MKSFWNSYYEQAHKKQFLIVTGLICFASQITIMNIVHPLNSLVVLQLQTSFSPDQFLEIIGQWESEGLLHYYQEHFFFDNVHPVWYGFFISSLLAFTFHRLNFDSKYLVYRATPFIAGMCDMVENLFHYWFLADLSRVTILPVSISAIFCLVKWILLLGSFIFVFYHLIKAKYN